MTLAAAVAYLGSMVGFDADSLDGASPTNQQLTANLFEAARQCYDEVDYYYGNVAWTPVAADQTYTLIDIVGTVTRFGANFIRPAVLIVNRIPLFDPNGKPGLWGWDLFTYRFYDWRNAASGKPWAATLDPEGTLITNCPISQATIDSAHLAAQGYGYPKLPTYDGTTSIAEFTVHPRLQWAVIKRAAVNAMIGYATEPDELGRMDRYRNESDHDLKLFRNESKRQQSPFMASDAYDRAGDRFWL